VQIRSQKSRLTVNPKKGAAIEELVLGDIHLIQPQANYHYESSLLFPFPNRLAQGQFDFEGKSYAFEINDFGKPNALHGLIHDMEFHPEAMEENSINLNLNYLGKHHAFPFPFDFEVTYQLEPTALTIRVAVHNTGESSFPFGFGWHPYFQLPAPEQTRLRLPSVTSVEVNDVLLPTGVRHPFKTFQEASLISGHQLDNCFAIQSAQVVNSTYLCLDADRTLEIWQDESFGFIQVFTPDDAKTVAIEPMTCNIDALNNGDGLAILRAGEQWTAQFGLRLKQESQR